MIAIAESGSTKCEWVIINNKGEEIKRFKTQGFNPDFHSALFVQNKLNQCADLNDVKEDIQKVFFYGASCSSPALCKIIQDGLNQIFVNASILVDHDLLAAAYSLYNGEPIISCILGTGSNSAYFDGKHVKECVPALGFIIGDEAGGGYFGKQLLNHYYYELLPSAIQDDFTTTFTLSWNDARKQIYGNEHANVYLASFMPFIAKHLSDPFIENMIREGIRKFIQIHVKCFASEATKTVAFVGTLSYVFKHIIQEEIEKEGFVLGKVIKSPIEELMQYHIQYLNILDQPSSIDKKQLQQ